MSALRRSSHFLVNFTCAPRDHGKFTAKKIDAFLSKTVADTATSFFSGRFHISARTTLYVNDQQLNYYLCPD